MIMVLIFIILLIVVVLCFIGIDNLDFCCKRKKTELQGGGSIGTGCNRDVVVCDDKTCSVVNQNIRNVIRKERKMRILFCKVTDMQYYKGSENKRLKGGGAYVDNTGDALEKYNFKERINATGERVCYGYFETKHVGGSDIYKRNECGRQQLHIEKIAGCETFNSSDSVDDVLIVFCTNIIGIGIRVVGWYKHATVYRNCHKHTFDGEIQYYFAKTESDNAVLLPHQIRHKIEWEVPSATKKSGPGFGFGQSLHWYATGKPGNDELNAKIRKFVDEMVNKINEFDGGI